MKTYFLQTMLVVIGLFVCSVVAKAQPVALKTNLVYDALTTPNLGIEIGLGPKNTVQLFYGLNPWKFGSSDNRKYMKHWMLNPEWRYWFCHRFNGSFIGVHALGGEYDATNVKLPFGLWDELQDHRFEGWYVGGGVSYGYQWVLSRHWNFEAAIGLGAAYIDYQKFKCGTCGKREGKGHKTYVGPTKIALSLVYNIGGNSTSTAATSQLARDDRPQPTAARQAEGASATLVDGKVSVSGATLKNVGQQMVLTMSVGLDELRLRHGQTVVLRPLLRSASGTDSIRFRPLLVNSRDMHIQHRLTRGGVTEIATSSLTMGACQYALVEAEEGQIRYETRRTPVSAWAAAQGRTEEELLDFETYAAASMNRRFRSQAEEQLRAAGLSGAELQELTDFACALNLAYFSGDLTGIPALDPEGRLLARLTESGGFLGSYIASMGEEIGRDHSRWES